MAYLAEGDLAGAKGVEGLGAGRRAAAAGAPAGGRPVRRDRAGRATVLMLLAWLRGDSARARAWADTSYRGNLKQLEAAPNGWSRC